MNFGSNGLKIKNMKIDKVIFPTSIEYSDFWNINSQIFKKCLNIEPLCLLFGKKEETNVSDEYGSVMEMEFRSNSFAKTCLYRCLGRSA